MKEEKEYKDIINKVFKVEVGDDFHKKYFQFLKEIKEYLKENYEDYFICFIILQDKNNKNIFYSVEVYNNLVDFNSAYTELSEKIEKKYKEEFNVKLKRIQVEDMSEIKKIYP